MNRSRFRLSLLCLGLLALLKPAQAQTGNRVAQQQPPLPQQEFRGAWIASVWNVDWPSKVGLSGAQQRAELIRILDVVAGLNMNAVILQVRPEGDALYRSELEPWSRWLSGMQGKPPSDGYDPLEFAIREAHARGLELHAWFNPFRARTSRNHAISSRHFSQKNPGLAMRAGTQDWLNPAYPEVRRHVINVMTDVARRYDIDGVHMDDYFYPYPKHTSSGVQQQYDDSSAYQAYRRQGGDLLVETWRKAHVDQFVRELNSSLKKVKPTLKFGISPFGIWRPGYPSSIEASIDSVLHLAGDSRTWLRQGWVDYLSPQLYWRIDQKEQSFTALTRWWDGENVMKRHLWPGIASSRIQSSGSDRRRYASESVKQIDAVRKIAGRQPGRGHIHWSVSALMDDRGGIKAQLRKSSYADLAVVPGSPWLAQGHRPAPPALMVEESGDGLQLRWLRPALRKNASIRWWILQVREKDGSAWETARILPGKAEGMTWKGQPAAIAVRAVDAAGQISEASLQVRSR